MEQQQQAEILNDAAREQLGKMTREIFLSIQKTEKSYFQDQLLSYHQTIENNLNRFREELKTGCGKYRTGRLYDELQYNLDRLISDFVNVRADVGSKYKVFIRGLGKAGKSTMLNALLNLGESDGSAVGIIPLTFTYDAFTNELPKDKAEVRRVNAAPKLMGKQKAREERRKETEAFKKSEEKCKKLIEKAIRSTYIEEERKKIEYDIYREHLLKTDIREVRWGIGENYIFDNVVLIDTPGLEQELRFTNELGELKSYEVDGILWVISSEQFMEKDAADTFEAEKRELAEIYKNKKVICMLNMVQHEGEPLTYGSRAWNRIQKKAEKIYCGECGCDAILCVNARMAYEGNEENNKQKTDASNISELRAKINEMFIEKSNEDYQREQKRKLLDLVDTIYKTLAGQKEAFEKILSEQNDIRQKIKIKKQNWTDRLYEEKEQLLSIFLAEIHSRIMANELRLYDLAGDDSLQEELNRYVESEILETAQMERQFKELLDRYSKVLFDQYKTFRDECIVSICQSKEYGKNAFYAAYEDMARMVMPDAKVSIASIDTSLTGAAGVIESVAQCFFGKSVKKYTNKYKPYAKRIEQNISRQLRSWSAAINLDQAIDYYGKRCEDILNRSFEQAGAEEELAADIVAKIGRLIKERPLMEWKTFDFYNAVGGIPYDKSV